MGYLLWKRWFLKKLKIELQHDSAILLLNVPCAQLCLTLCDPLDCSLPGSSVHGVFQAKMLEQDAIFSSRGSS